MQIITHHNVDFMIDVCDWKNAEAESQIASDALENGILKLSAKQVQIIATSWKDAEAECESRNSNDEATQIIESIENSAFDLATKGWLSTPDIGHNCFVGLVQNVENDIP